MDEDDLLPEVVDDVAHSRFVVETGGAAAELLYRLDGDRLILLHTEVPVSLGGRGIGGELVAAGVARAAREGLILVPWCPYARKRLADHPDVPAGVTIDWSDPPANRR